MIPPRPRPLLGGVCARVAERFAIDVSLVRLMALLLVLAWGLGALGYLVAWLVMVGEGMPRGYGGRVRHLRRDARASGARLREAWQRAGQGEPWPRPLSRRWVGLGLVAAGVAILLASVGAFSWLSPLRALGLAALAGGASLLVSLRV